ncbi:MAG: carboxypeptidase-like regulatory domain-containing protein [Salinivirgaceae bacterium]|jgi:hypothetical protein|nr:carboxypeptidase-like regulatory domain-containing protein [Salinivirgaceae bacterium]
MKKYILLVIYSLIVVNLLAQKSNFVIEGIISDGNGNAIENVNIYNSTNIGTVSDRNGEFKLSVTSLDKELFVSHVAYKTKRIFIKRDLIENGTLFIRITLEEKPYLLNSVDIAGSNDWQVIKSKKTWIYDYELHGENLVILLHDSAKYELKYLDRQDSLLFSYVLNERKVNGFIKDGLGNIHIGINDSVFQLYITDNRIGFYEGVSQNDYEKLLQPIVADTDSLLLMQYLALNNQKIIYLGFNKTSKTTIPIAEVISKEQYQYSLQAKEQQLKSYGVNIMGDIGPKELVRYREFYQWGSYIDKVATLPIYSPLIKMEDGFCIFNLVDNKIDHYNESGRLIKAVNASFNASKKILSIEIDKFTNRVYSIWKTSGRISIDEIDIDQGSIKKSVQLKNYTFPEKIIMCNSNVYFLHKDLNSSRKLVRIPLQKLIAF